MIKILWTATFNSNWRTRSYRMRFPPSETNSRGMNNFTTVKKRRNIVTVVFNRWWKNPKKKKATQGMKRLATLSWFRTFLTIHFYNLTASQSTSNWSRCSKVKSWTTKRSWLSSRATSMLLSKPWRVSMKTSFILANQEHWNKSMPGLIKSREGLLTATSMEPWNLWVSRLMKCAGTSLVLLSRQLNHLVRWCLMVVLSSKWFSSQGNK